MTRRTRFVRGGKAASPRHPGRAIGSILVWTTLLGGGCAEVLCEGGQVFEGDVCVCPEGQSLTGGVCRPGDDPCMGFSCDDGNECTNDACVVADGEATCPFVPLDDGMACSSGAGECAAGRCVVSESISVACADNAFSEFSIADWELSVALDGVVTGGEDFDATFDGTVVVAERVLDVLELAVPPGFTRIALVDLAATVLVRAGATGNPVTLRAADIPYACEFDGASCDPANSEQDGSNEDCMPTGSFNQCLAFIDVPIIEGTPTVTDGCTPPVEGCDCSECEALDAPLDASKANQCASNGFCVSEPLRIPLAAATAAYTADETGEVLFGWDDENTGATIRSDGTYDLPSAKFGEPTAPNGVRLVVASALFPALQCTMAVDSADPNHGVGVPGRASPTPDELLLAIPIAE